MTLRAIWIITIATVILGGCNLSEPLPPVLDYQSTLFQERVGDRLPSDLSEDERVALWIDYEREFSDLRANRDFVDLLKLARDAQSVFHSERAAWVNLSTALLIQGEFGQTLTAAEGALGRDVTDELYTDQNNDLIALAWGNIASAQIELHQLNDALDAAESGLANSGEHARLQLLKGEALHRLERNEEAVEAYRAAFDLDPEPPEIVSSDCVTCARAMIDLGDLDGAEATLRSGIAQFGHDFGLHFNLALVKQRQGQFEDAFYEYHHEIFARPDTPYRDRVAAEINALLQQMQAFPDDPRYQPLLQLARAMQAQEVGNRPQATEIFTALLEHRPANDTTIYLPLVLARLAVEQGDLTTAERWQREVIRRDPGFIPSMFDLAEIRDHLGDREEATELLHRAHALDPHSWRLDTFLQSSPGSAEMVSPNL